MFGKHRVEERPDAELFGAVAFQSDLRDTALDHLDANPPIVDVLRRNDCATEVEAGRSIEIADAARDGREVGLRDFLSEIGLIGRYQSIVGYRPHPGKRNAPKYEQRFAVTCRL